MLNSVKKIGSVLELFSPDQPEWRLSEVSRELGIPKSTTHALMAALVEIGLLSPSLQGGYRLGPGLLCLGERMRAGLDFRTHAVPVMRLLSESLLESSHLAILDRHRVVYLERVDGQHPAVRLAGDHLEAMVPAHASAAGKVMLAHQDLDAMRHLMRGRLQRCTERTITEMPRLEDELRRVRVRGFAADLAETTPDVASLAAPVVDRFGTVVAAIGISMPSYRFDASRAKTLERLLQATSAVSDELQAAPAARDFRRSPRAFQPRARSASATA